MINTLCCLVLSRSPFLELTLGAMSGIALTVASRMTGTTSPNPVWRCGQIFSFTSLLVNRSAYRSRFSSKAIRMARSGVAYIRTIGWTISRWYSFSSSPSPPPPPPFWAEEEKEESEARSRMTGKRGAPPDPDENSNVCTSEGSTLYLRNPFGNAGVFEFAAPAAIALSVRINRVRSSSVARAKPSSAAESLTNRFEGHHPSAPGCWPRSRNAVVFNRAAGFGLPSRRQGWNNAGGKDPRACGSAGVSEGEEGERNEFGKGPLKTV